MRFDANQYRDQFDSPGIRVPFFVMLYSRKSNAYELCT